MKNCSNCGKSHGPLKRYMWNTRTRKGTIAQSHAALLCEICAKSLGAWQVVGKGETITIPPGEEVRWTETILTNEETITIGTPEEAARVAMSLTDEDIERLEREEKEEAIRCVYDVDKVGTHQCPKCKRWYCDECFEMFLPIDNKNWVATNLMCTQCHYEVYAALQ